MGREEFIEYSFSDNVIEHLVADSCDAAVMGLLMLAIRLHCDISSSLPISSTLYYRLTNHFIPGICGEQIYRPQIIAPITSDYLPAEKGNIVATGISCGVDSLYTVQNHTNQIASDYNLTHLVYLNAGASKNDSSDKSEALYKSRRDLALKFSNEVNLPLIEIQTNLPDLIDKYYKYNHIEFHTYMMLSCILSIGRGVSKYYYSAGMPYSQFDCKLKSTEILCCAHYDLFILWCASSKHTQFYSTGGHISRYEKVLSIGSFDLSTKYLNVCVESDTNCGHCFKCKRTLIELDAAGTINNYGRVFNLKKYEISRRKILTEAYIAVKEGDEMQNDVFGFICDSLSNKDKIKIAVRLLYRKLMRKSK